MPTGPQAEEKDFKSAYRDIEARPASAQTPGGIDVSVGVTYGVGASNGVSNGVGNGNGIDVSVLIPATYKETKTRMASKQKTPTHSHFHLRNMSRPSPGQRRPRWMCTTILVRGQSPIFEDM